MGSLHMQLKRILSQKYNDIDFNVGQREKLPPLINMTLRKAMTSGWADQVHLDFEICLLQTPFGAKYYTLQLMQRDFVCMTTSMVF